MTRITTALMVLGLGAATACGASPPKSAENATVTFMTFGDPDELRAFRNVIGAYDAKQSKVDVKLIEASDRKDLLARLATGFGGGTPPDTFLINYRFYGQFAAKGVLEPLDERVSTSKRFQESDFYPQVLDAFRFGGRLTCLPQNISSLVVYYNKDLFAKYGVEVPAKGWRWRDMTTLARILTRDLDGDGTPDQYGLGVDPQLIRIAPFIWSNGGELLRENGAGFALGSAEAREALDEFLSLRTGYGVIPSDEETESEDNESRFLNGRTAMLFDSRRIVPTLRTITKFDWDVAPLPKFKVEASILHADAYCMTATSRNKDAAWDFIEFALGEEGQRIAARTGRTVPSMKKVATSADFLDPGAKPKNSQVFLDAIPNIRYVPGLSTWPEIEDAANPILEEAFYEGAESGEVFVELDRQTKGIFARAER